MNRMKAFGALMGARGDKGAVVFDDAGRPSLLKVFSGYVIDIAALSEGSSGTGSVTIQSDSDFVVQQLTGVGLLNDNTYITGAGPVATVQITDTGSAFNLFNSPIYWANLFGTAQLPYILPVPRLIKANAKINVTINLIDEGASDNHFQVALLGYRLYSFDN